MHLIARLSLLKRVRIVAESIMYCNPIRSYLRLRLLDYVLFAIQHAMSTIFTYPSTYITMVCQACKPRCDSLRNFLTTTTFWSDKQGRNYKGHLLVQRSIESKPFCQFYFNVSNLSFLFKSTNYTQTRQLIQTYIITAHRTQVQITS